MVEINNVVIDDDDDDNDDDCDTTYDMSYEKLVQVKVARHMKGSIGWLEHHTMHAPRHASAAP